MVVRRRKKKVSIPTREDSIQGDFIDTQNDLILKSRTGKLVDIGGDKPKIINRRNEAKRVFDSNKDNFGNSGIARLPILRDGEKW